MRNIFIALMTSIVFAPVVAADTLFVYERNDHVVITNYDVPSDTVMLRISEHTNPPYTFSSMSNQGASSHIASFMDPLPPPGRIDSKKPASSSETTASESLLLILPDSAKPASAPETATEQVFFTMETDDRYHTDQNCGGGTGVPTPFAEIQGRNLKPCENCVK